MSTLFCCDSLRKSAVEHSADGNAIEFIKVLDGPRTSPKEILKTLLIYCRVGLPSSNLTAEHVRIESADGRQRLPVLALQVDQAGRPEVLSAKVAMPEAPASYTLKLVDPAAPDKPPPGFTLPCASISFGSQPELYVNRWNGIDFLQVLDDPAGPLAERQTTLLVHFIRDIAAPLSLVKANVRIEGGERLRNIKVDAVEQAPLPIPPGAPPGSLPALQPRVLRVKVAAPGDFSDYTLRLVDPALPDERPPAGIDRQLAAIRFNFKAACRGDFDCAGATPCPPDAAAPPQLNYLARDYASFRQLMLDRLALTVPGWAERNEADLGLVLVELLAYVADRLAYEQDAVATEAYLGTARLRSSIRRHARLVDYPMHDGCNARSFVQLRAEAGVAGVPVHARVLSGGRYRPTQLLTRCDGLPVRLAIDSPAHQAALARGPQVFELMHDITLYATHNDIPFYTWGARECCLPRGATRASLRGHFPGLRKGDVLILTEARNPDDGTPENANPARRHAVRLCAEPLLTTDALGGRFKPEPDDSSVPVTEIEWHLRDALPFALTLSSRRGTDYFDELSLAHGNIVLADHGLTTYVKLPPVPGTNPVLKPAPATGGQACSSPPVEARPQHARFRPRLPTKDQAITQNSPLADGQLPDAARDALDQDLRLAVADVKLDADGLPWKARRDLLSSKAQDADFVVEVEADGSAWMRFGDGEFGRCPAAGTVFEARLRLGNGSAGNLGAGIRRAESPLFHLASVETPPVEAVWNPLPARGGVEPESIESVRQRAPSAIGGDIQRAVTPADYALLAQREDPSIQRAAASLRWTGSWRTVFLSADRYGAADVDQGFEDVLISRLEPYRLAGQDLEVDAPHYVSLEIALGVCVKADYERSRVEAALRALLGSRVLPDGRRGVFHPDNFSFGQTVYLSPIQAAALGVDGVDSIVVERFQRQGQPATEGTGAGCLLFARNEIPRLDDDRNYPDRGALSLTLTGGK